MRVASRRWSAWGPGVLLLLPATFATAQQLPAAAPSSNPLRLTWVSTEASCTGTDVVAEARALVAPGVTPQPVVARASVSRDPAGWGVRLETRSGNQTGQRSLRGGTCREIQQAIGLLLAMTMESGHLSGEAAPATPTAPEPTPPDATPPAPATAPAVASTTPAAAVPPHAAAAPRQPVPAAAGGLSQAQAAPATSSADALSIVVRLNAEAAYGLQPGVGFGASVGAGVAWKAAEISVGASQWLATEEEIFSGQARLEVVRQSLDLSACAAVWGSAHFDLLACLAGELTFLRSRPLDIVMPQTAPPKKLGSLSGSVDLRYWLPGRQFFIFVKPGITWEKPAVFRAKLNCADCEWTPVYDTPGVGVRLRAGVGARF